FTAVNSMGINCLRTPRSISSSGLEVAMSGAWSPGTVVSTVVLGIWGAADCGSGDGPPGAGSAADDISRLGLAGGSITVVIHARVRTVSDPSNKPVPARIASLSKPPNSSASAATPSLEPPDDRLSGPTGVPFGPMMLLNNR